MCSIRKILTHIFTITKSKLLYGTLKIEPPLVSETVMEWALICPFVRFCLLVSFKIKRYWDNGGSWWWWGGGVVGENIKHFTLWQKGKCKRGMVLRCERHIFNVHSKLKLNILHNFILWERLVIFCNYSLFCTSYRYSINFSVLLLVQNPFLGICFFIKLIE